MACVPDASKLLSNARTSSADVLESDSEVRNQNSQRHRSQEKLGARASNISLMWRFVVPMYISMHKPILVYNGE